MGHGPQRRADARAVAGRLRDGGRAEVARRAAAVRPAVRPVERARLSGRRQRRRVHGPAALRLRVQQHRAAARGHLRASRAPRPTAGACGRSTSSSTPSRRRRGASPRQDVAAAVARSNALLPSGEFIAPKFDANVYTNAIPKRVATIGDAPVKVVGDKPVLIRDVARVEDGGTPATQSSRSTGRTPSISTCSASPAATRSRSSTRSRRSSRACSDLPPGMQAKVYFDQSTFVRTAYHGLKKEIVQALVLIALVILLFLQSVRGTLIVSVAIPLSFAITLIVLYATGQTLNAFTLGGLTLAMGRLVDDAVVVLESIHRHQRMGMSTAEAALEGTNAVALPVLASTLTTMAVLLARGAPRGARAQALRAARAHRRRRDDRVVLREHGGDARRVPLLPRPRRARPLRQSRRRRSSIGSPRAIRVTLRVVLPFRWTIVVARLRPRRRPGVGRVAAAEHVLSGDRRVDGHDLRPLRAGRLGRRRGQEDDRDGPGAHAGAPRGHRRDGRRERRHAAERAQPPREPERRPRTPGTCASPSRTPRSASCRRRSIADARARHPRRASSRASRCSSIRAVSSPASSRTGTPRRSSSRSATTTSPSWTRRRRPSPTSRGRSRASAT